MRQSTCVFLIAIVVSALSLATDIIDSRRVAEAHALRPSDRTVCERYLSGPTVSQPQAGLGRSRQNRDN